MLSVENLECRYGKVAAVRSLSLEVRQGELVSLIGANGAGKTTTLRAISGVLLPFKGKIIFEGEDITRASPRRVLELDVPEGELAARREKLLADLGGYRPRDRQRPVSAALQAYAAMATSASTGAARDITQLG